MRRLQIPESAIHIGGGEPFGNFPLLIQVLKAAQAAGLDGVGYVETNGYWAADDELTRQRLALLLEHGVRQISLSVDVYHQVHVGIDGPLRLARLARELLGEHGLRVRRWQNLKHPQDLRQVSPRQRREAYIEALKRFPERMTGRAADELATLVAGRPIDDYKHEDCRQGLLESAHVHVDPAGYVHPGTCAGLLLGRAADGPELDDLPARPRGELWRTLVRGGPAALAALAGRMGYIARPSGYADKCHLCTDVRQWLFEQGAYPAELGPAELYREADSLLREP